MKKKKVKREKLSKKILLFRIGTVALLIVIGAVMMVIGRGHTLYLDNKPCEIGGTEYKAYESISIPEGGEKPINLLKRDRGKIKTMGQSIELYLEVKKDKNSEKSAVTVEIPIPYELDNVLINLPACLAGLPADKYLSEFIIQEEVEEEPGETEEGLPGEDFGGGEM